MTSPLSHLRVLDMSRILAGPWAAQTLADLDSFCANEAEKLGIAVDCRQSNHEGDLVDWIQESHGKADAILLNAAAYARTSMAIQSAVRAVSTPIIEIHITNIYTKEAARNKLEASMKEHNYNNCNRS